MLISSNTVETKKALQSERKYNNECDAVHTSKQMINEVLGEEIAKENHKNKEV